MHIHFSTKLTFTYLIILWVLFFKDIYLMTLIYIMLYIKLIVFHYRTITRNSLLCKYAITNYFSITFDIFFFFFEVFMILKIKTSVNLNFRLLYASVRYKFWSIGTCSENIGMLLRNTIPDKLAYLLDNK